MTGSGHSRSLDGVVDLPMTYQEPPRSARTSFRELLSLVEAEEDRVISLQVVSSLAEMGAMGVPYLLDALKDSDQAVRKAAAEALSQPYQDSDLQALIVASLVRAQSADPAAAVRWSAVLSLGWIGSQKPLFQPAIIPALAERLSDKAQPFFNQVRVADVAANALERIGTADAYAALEAYYAD